MINQKRLWLAETTVELKLRKVSEEIKDQMQIFGWHDDRIRRTDRPTDWHINCGWCEEWALLAKSVVGGEDTDLIELGFDEDKYAHIILVLDGRFYDSQNPEGVDDVNDMQLVRLITFEQWLELKKL